jgi:excisionase family DNA binding protein
MSQSQSKRQPTQNGSAQGIEQGQGHADSESNFRGLLGIHLRPSRRHLPRTPTHYEPSGFVPGPHLSDPERQQGPRLGGGRRLGRASGSRFWHGFAVRTTACKEAQQRTAAVESRSLPGGRCSRGFCWTLGAEEMHADSDNDFERLLSPEEVASACGLSRRAIYRAIGRGELQAARLCHRLRVSPAELERWVDEQAASPEPPMSKRRRRSVKDAGPGSLRALLDAAETS